MFGLLILCCHNRPKVPARISIPVMFFVIVYLRLGETYLRLGEVLISEKMFVIIAFKVYFVCSAALC